MKIEIYQINEERDKSVGGKSVLFQGFLNAILIRGHIDRKIYDKVYEGEFGSDKTESSVGILEKAFCVFQLGHQPAGFTGRSMSVSDIVVLDDGKEQTAFFCDNIGWQKVENFCKEEPAAYYTAHDIAAKLGVSYQTALNWIKESEVKHKIVGNRYCVPAKAFDEWLHDGRSLHFWKWEKYAELDYPLAFVPIHTTPEKTVKILAFFDECYGNTANDTGVWALEFQLLTRMLVGGDSCLLVNPYYLDFDGCDNTLRELYDILGKEDAETWEFFHKKDTDFFRKAHAKTL